MTLPSERSATQWRRGGLALAIGAAGLLAIAAASVVTPSAATSTARQGLANEPSHVALVRSLLAPVATADSICVTSIGAIDIACTVADASALGPAPSPSAVIGATYRFTPTTTRTVREWTATGRPEELQLDPVTGVLSGTPRTLGRYDLVLSARIADDTVLTRSLTLYVDDHALLLGADRFGDDVFQSLLRSTRVLLLPGLLTALIGVGLGTLFGAWAGFYGGAARTILTSLTSAVQSLPGLMLVFVAASASDLNRWVITAVIGVILLPETAQGVAERVERFRRRDFVDAARELGMRDGMILWNEIVWHNARDFILHRATNAWIFAMLMDVTLSYVGLVDGQTSTLGGMLRSGRAALTGGSSGAEAFAALSGILFVVATFTLLDRGVRAAWARSR